MPFLYFLGDTKSVSVQNLPNLQDLGIRCVPLLVAVTVFQSEKVLIHRQANSAAFSYEYQATNAV